jgi:hypothetical protein
VFDPCGDLIDFLYTQRGIRAEPTMLSRKAGQKRLKRAADETRAADNLELRCDFTRGSAGLDQLLQVLRSVEALSSGRSRHQIELFKPRLGEYEAHVIGTTHGLKLAVLASKRA